MNLSLFLFTIIIIITLISSFGFVDSQQPYIRTASTGCWNRDPSTSVFGYTCNGETPSCQSYLLYHSQPPYNTVSSISSLFAADPSQVAQLNSVSINSSFKSAKMVLVPVNCSCSGTYYQVNTTYVVKPLDFLINIANNVFEGLTTCVAIEAQNNIKRLNPGESITVPLRCACPTKNQTDKGIKYLLSYVIVWGDDIWDISAMFKVDTRTTVLANSLSNQDVYVIYPNTTLLIPLQTPPPSSTQINHYTRSVAQPPQSPTALGPSYGSGKSSKSKKIIIVVCTIVTLLVLCLCFFITRRRQLKANTGHKGEEEEELLKSLRTETTQYDLDTIRAATEEFSTANMLGRGGFGEVYKGVLSDGKEIAVKRLSTMSSQGEKEFENEVLLLARLQHTCLVKLLGFCLEQKERLLVYEFMGNGSLDKVIFDQENRSKLDWEGRYKIIKSIARGLLYLHEDSRLNIIHRDLKTSNILLDGDMNAKISDFGMARLFDRNEGEVVTKKIAGTLGYMAPEYAMHGLFSVKSDVYSYGVMLLEIVSGKRIYYSLTEDSSEGLLSYAYKTWKEGNASELIDPMLPAGSDSPEHMMRCIHIALLCVQNTVGSRPTMTSVNLMLQSLTITIPIPFEPGFFNNINRPLLLKLLESNAHNDPALNKETDSYLCPR